MKILQLLNEASDTRAYLKLGYSSLFDWLTKGFGYSNAAAYRRIEAARLLRAVPGLEEKLENGNLSLTSVCTAQKFIKAKEKFSGAKLTLQAKKDLLERIENKPAHETEKILFQVFPETKSVIHQERKVQLDESTTRHSLNFTSEMSENLKRAKEILSHQIPEGKDSDVIAYVLDFFLKKKDPLRSDLSRKRSLASVRPNNDSNQRTSEHRKSVSRKQRGSVLEHDSPKERFSVGSNVNIAETECFSGNEIIIEIKNASNCENLRKKARTREDSKNNFTSAAEAARVKPLAKTDKIRTFAKEKCEIRKRKVESINGKGQFKFKNEIKDERKAEYKASGLSLSLKKKILKQFNGRCSFQDPDTGKTCESTYQVQIDHIHPKALGGTNSPHNLRTLCRKHNLLEAERALGEAKIAKTKLKPKVH